MDFTHFLSIPLNTQCIKETFIKFCNDVSLSESNLQSNIFQKPELLHLTIGVMALLSEKELKLAIQTLNECVKEIVKPILDNESLTISIGGLQIMNDDPSSTCVVYAKITSNKLQEIADKIVEKFSTMGIITRESDHVKLHMTVMNTKFIFSNDVRNKKRISIDASRILANFDGTDFGKVTLKEIHLSEMGHSKKLLKDYYLPSHIVHF
uniref:Activating signal cointegrator 1 complex subunit 1like [Megachile rotundata] n=2 Tax=Lepeophtheirus salmonis TaxID=72036 RepID=A0A0K2UPE1_LEPSM